MEQDARSAGQAAQPAPDSSVTLVGIALVCHRGRFLVGRRGPNSTLAGLSEFPGGKCLPGETPADCAVRECLEETGLEIEVVQLLRDLRHNFPYGTVHLHFFDCRLAAAAASPDPNPGFVWVPASELATLDFPEPNRALIELIARSESSGLAQQ